MLYNDDSGPGGHLDDAPAPTHLSPEINLQLEPVEFQWLPQSKHAM